MVKVDQSTHNEDGGREDAITDVHVEDMQHDCSSL